MSQELEKPDHSAEDALLVRRFQSGKDITGAIEALFERYGMATYAFFCRGVGNPQIAEELNQDLYVEVIKGLRRFRGQSSFKTWLFVLAYNRLANLRRRWRTHLDEHPVDAPEELWLDVADDEARSPEAELHEGETRKLLRRCMARLPEVERAIVLGKYYRGNTLQELTTRLELTNPSGARASLLAAQRKLKKCLERFAFAITKKKPRK